MNIRLLSVRIWDEEEAEAEEAGWKLVYGALSIGSGMAGS